MIETTDTDDHAAACRQLREALATFERLGLSTAAALVSHALDEADCAPNTQPEGQAYAGVSRSAE